MRVCVAAHKKVLGLLPATCVSRSGWLWCRSCLAPDRTRSPRDALLMRASACTRERANAARDTA